MRFKIKRKELRRTKIKLITIVFLLQVINFRKKLYKQKMILQMNLLVLNNNYN